MANITISGASTGSFNMTDEIQDIGMQQLFVETLLESK